MVAILNQNKNHIFPLVFKAILVIQTKRGREISRDKEHFVPEYNLRGY